MTTISVNVFVNNKDELCATLTRSESVTCEDIAFWDDIDSEGCLEALFEEWGALADAGEEGYYKT